MDRFFFTKFAQDKDTANSLANIVLSSVALLYGITIVQVANIPLNTFAFIGGALALGVGFASQNLLNNFLSSAIIMVEKSIKIDDIIEINGIRGVVTEIGARCTTVTTFNRVDVLVPNSKLLQEYVANWSCTNDVVGFYIKVMFPKANDKTLSKRLQDFYAINNDGKAHDSICVIKMLQRLLLACPHVLSDPTPEAFLTGITQTHYQYTVSYACHIKSLTSTAQIQHDINLAIAGLSDQIVIEHVYLSVKS